MKKVLIANRGEIAARIIRTCQQLNIQTVAIFSEADKEAIHVKMADEAYEVGGARVSESYLNKRNILQIAKDANVDAIHPGYGLLSENAGFAKEVEEEGIAFIGPKDTVIYAMGDKINARAHMEQIGIPVVPGMTLEDQSERSLEMAARKIGFPLMVKASAGGGGIGMQRVHDQKELVKAVSSVAKKAQTFFGEGALFLEKYIEKPRHIEAQIVGDLFGEVEAIGLRDCSIQRRHQKIVEEAPPPRLSKNASEQLLEYAKRIGESLEYSSVGTVEFLVDHEENIYFLEVNTRLQVEHPVTEETEGVDLVEWQLRLSEKEKLEALPRDKRKSEHAIEVRIYAEDPKTFFPSPGALKKFRFKEVEGIRFDMGVEEGMNVTPYYDPMIGKVIAYASSREACVDKLLDVLTTSEVEGIKTNIPMLVDVLQSEAFRAGEVTTHFVSQPS
ncbi:ATP-grasp domain-containing protein [Paenalkalicoccus suaedae]|uniref:biotin carboxylase n=1 Tax=Paenalkalicoccus suaedae TaxID=2592382 RepID=A0A859FD97_9BACI|nr:biotin carboxylase N-terminal domain-containing protein [Paenalkalicoccus suaedae]QKS70722.1 ATP-grasp domain-containing protein [Paenalkalicoccus suaedae]